MVYHLHDALHCEGTEALAFILYNPLAVSLVMHAEPAASD